MTTIRRSCLHAITSVTALLLMTAVLVLSPTSTRSADALTLHQRDRIIAIAASRRGSPYAWGAAGPHRFDCSGYTRWVFARIGRHLPHNSSMQYHRVRHVRASHRKRGDLVFFHSGRHVFHVGIYAGHHRIWHAPHSGSRVHRERIWTHAVWYGRVR